MASLSSCPACNTTLTLFTPREISRHINTCLDAHPQESQSHHSLPRCPVCQRDLSPLTAAARAEHENRCVDNLNPRPEKNLSLKQTKLTPARPRSRPKQSNHDKRVRCFLELLGLDRYAQRFADEEVDFPALRLLEDKDFAHLRIPDAARRRIADALTAVPILAQLEGAQLNQPIVDPALVPTQRFGTSRLAPQMQRNKPLVQLDDSDGEYAPTPIVENSLNHTRLVTDKTCKEQDVDERKETKTSKDSFRAVENVSGGASNEEQEPNEFEEIGRVVKSGHVARASESSSVSSFGSNPEDISDLLRSTSQITIELKLQKWRRKQIQKEKCRHTRELRRIEIEYNRLIKNTKIHDGPKGNEAGRSPEVPKTPAEHNGDTIDLTQDISYEEDNPETQVAKVGTAEVLPKSIVISSNESALNASSTPPRDSQQVQRKGDSCPMLSQKEAELDNITRSNAQPHSPTSETRTPDQSKQKTSQEEVIDLISAEKEHGSERRLNVTLPGNRNNIAPLFAITPERDEMNGALKSTSDSDEDFMDLLSVGKENSKSNSQPPHPPEEALKRSSTAYDSSNAEEAPTQSRLKKRTKKGKRVKATSQDIAQLIRMDKALYEDILMMDSVPFDRIFNRLRGGQKHVTKRALYDFLQDEGIMVKGDSVEPGSQQELYMLHLNSDICAD